MEGIELLQELQTQKDTLNEVFTKEKTELSNKLLTLFNTVGEGLKLELAPIDIAYRESWSYKHEKSKFECYFNINFLTKDPERIAKGYKRDFGSDITMYVYEDGIEMNYGTCGNYTHNDLGQISRAFLIPKLWENEDTIIAMIKATIDYENFKKLEEVKNKIAQINCDIQTAERLRKRNETLKELNKAKFICLRRKDDKGHWEGDKWIKEKSYYYYYGFEEIKKITDKSVMTRDSYFHDNHRRDLDVIISEIQNGYKFLQTERVDKEEVPAE